MAAIIQIRGARTHNLQNIDVDIPRNKLVVITGVSGSGKSSLAFDTLLAEGQRQYVQSLSIYARQFFERMERPDVDRIEGLQPTIAIDQRPGAPNPRSTVATITEIYDYLRVLFARCGDVACPNCGTPVVQQTPAQIEAAIRALPEGTRVMLLAPLIRGRKGAHQDVLISIQKAGLVRARVDGVIYPLEDVPQLSPQQPHTMDAVVDRIVVREGLESRLGESVRLAVKLGDGVAIAMCQTPDAKENDAWQERFFSTRYSCPRCGSSIGEIEPRTFSFNSPYGACETCQGLGVVGGTPLSLSEECATDEARKSTQATPIAEPLGMPPQTCPDCGGARLRPEGRAVRLRELAIYEITALHASDSLSFFHESRFDDERQAIAAPLVAEITRRLEFLQRVGADYLSLDRPADTLSGGERQRVRLAAGIGSGLVGVLYLLDEPSIGLHPRDNDRLIQALRELQRQGNSVVVVEHDEALMRASDWLIDIGPGAGSRGGRVVASGTPDDVAKDEDSITGAYLSGRRSILVPSKRRPIDSSRTLRIAGVSTHNLQNVDVEIPLGMFVCVTGVSGSGKSSLVLDTLVPAVAAHVHEGSWGQATASPQTESASWGLGSASTPAILRITEHIDRLVQVDASPIGRTPRSSAATYTGIWNDIRRVFAGTKLARQRGYGAARFSFNAAGGRCEECKGAGLRRMAMKVLPDLVVTCPICHGQRFNRQTLAIRFRDRSIADVLAMSVLEAAEFFVNHESIRRTLVTLADVGLGYLTIGQPATTLSGGEAQRIKLATELARPATGRTLYILDEPTTGLSTDDIGRLLGVLHRLVDAGHSMLVIEHNLDVIKTADWVIDLGPEGGAGGGRIVVAGTPEDVAACEASHTGRFLRRLITASEPGVRR